MIAQADPKFRSTRASRIRYDLPGVMRQRARAKQEERQQTARGAWIIGRFVYEAASGRVVLEAIQRDYRSWAAIDDAAPLTQELARMARWRTRQGARQWLLRHPRRGCMLVNIHRARFVDPSCPMDNTPAVTLQGPRAGAASRQTHPGRSGDCPDDNPADLPTRQHGRRAHVAKKTMSIATFQQSQSRARSHR